MCSQLSKNDSTSPSSYREEGLPLYSNHTYVSYEDCSYDRKSNLDNKPKQNNAVVGRFAPTPSGKLHLGNLFSFMIAYLVARRAGGSVHMRIEDLDQHGQSKFMPMECFGALRRSASNGTTNPYTKALESKHIKKRIKSLIEKGFYIPAFALVLIYTLQMHPILEKRFSIRVLVEL